MIEPITEASLRKKLAWDLIPHPHVEEMMSVIGLVPGSSEGEDLEHRASHLRELVAEPIVGVLTLLGSLSGEIVARCILENQGTEPDEETVEMYQALAVTTSHAVLINLLDLNLIHLGGHP